MNSLYLYTMDYILCRISSQAVDLLLFHQFMDLFIVVDLTRPNEEFVRSRLKFLRKVETQFVCLVFLYYRMKIYISEYVHFVVQHNRTPTQVPSLPFEAKI